jgi:hypothetical protein
MNEATAAHKASRLPPSYGGEFAVGISSSSQAGWRDWAGADCSPAQRVDVLPASDRTRVQRVTERGPNQTHPGSRAASEMARG